MPPILVLHGRYQCGTIQVGIITILTHATIAFLFSKVTETTWKEYIEKVQGGELCDGDLLWNVNIHETD